MVSTGKSGGVIARSLEGDEAISKTLEDCHVGTLCLLAMTVIQNYYCLSTYAWKCLIYLFCGKWILWILKIWSLDYCLEPSPKISNYLSGTWG